MCALAAKMKIALQQSLGIPCLVTIEFINEDIMDLYVLTHCTPLEGLFSDCFDVHLDGKAVPYCGPMVKRATPIKKDYVKIPVGKSISTEVDLSLCYKLTCPGNYEVTYRGIILDVITESEWHTKIFGQDAHHVQLEVNKQKFTIKNS